eukprot:CAMPEP_0119356160 /NCGR_PEP_ID=MMETSP1334-20130426/4835_1 /TAXON_ID=127549 /ORGANISM="Calcidiscus leptoporus, Strain RCC1130" /LENGTH=490 /DNA_ID=CAMNT_0007370135 /DNA_START=28 /DNA_END=1501 /DNA_ORIENTATION=-
MNLALIDPFELHAELPEMIEDKMQVESAVLVCSFNRRGNLLAGGCVDGRVVVWDFETHGVARTLHLHAARVSAVSWTRSSRRLLSASADSELILWEVLSGIPSVRVDLGGVEIVHAEMHPRSRKMCLACMNAAGTSRSAVYLQHFEPERRVALVSALETDEENPGSKPDACTAVCFDSKGERVLIGSSKGIVRLLEASSGAELAVVQIGTGASIKSLGISRDGQMVVLNCADRVIRALQLERVLEGGRTSGRELQDVVNRTPWSHACFTADGEHVIGASAGGAEQKLYIWDLHGHLTKMLDGPKADSAFYFAPHPTRPILACCSRSGAVYIWTKQYCENWSAFAPDFKELEENEEYEEKEDEFDVHPAQEETKEDEEEELIDVLTIEPSELAHFPDDDDDDTELGFLPTEPEPDEEQTNAGEAMDTGQNKQRKRKMLPTDASKGFNGRRADRAQAFGGAGLAMFLDGLAFDGRMSLDCAQARSMVADAPF